MHRENSYTGNLFYKFPDVFGNEIGQLPGVVYMTLNKEAKPFAVLSCKVPIKLAEVKSKLLELEEQKII